MDEPESYAFKPVLINLRLLHYSTLMNLPIAIVARVISNKKARGNVVTRVGVKPLSNKHSRSSIC